MLRNKPNINSFLTVCGPFEAIASFLSPDELKKLSLTSLGFFHTTVLTQINIKKKFLIELLGLCKQIAYFLIENKASIYSGVSKRLVIHPFKLNDEVMEKLERLDISVKEDMTVLIGKLSMLTMLIAEPLDAYLKNNIETFLLPTEGSSTKEEFYKNCLNIVALLARFKDEEMDLEMASLKKIDSVVKENQEALYERFLRLFMQALEEQIDLTPLRHLLSFAIDINYRFEQLIPELGASKSIIALALKKTNKKMVALCLENKADISDALFHVFYYFNPNVFSVILGFMKDRESSFGIKLCLQAMVWGNLKALKMIHKRFPALIQQALEVSDHKWDYYAGYTYLGFYQFLLNFKLGQKQIEGLIVRAARDLNYGALKLLFECNQERYQYNLYLTYALFEAERVGHNLYLDSPSFFRKIMGRRNDGEKEYVSVIGLLKNTASSPNLKPHCP
ncbi:MAG: hypothetical protein ACYCQI_06315 [Gammaproteobacteria bacterium]